MDEDRVEQAIDAEYEVWHPPLYESWVESCPTANALFNYYYDYKKYTVG